MEEGWLQSNVAQRRSAKDIAIFWIEGDLLQSEILVLGFAIEGKVSQVGSDLRHADYMAFEIAEHFIRRSRNGMALNTTPLSKEDESPLFLAGGEFIPLAASELVYGCVSENEREFKFSDRLPEQVEIDRCAPVHFRK